MRQGVAPGAERGEDRQRSPAMSPAKPHNRPPRFCAWHSERPGKHPNKNSRSQSEPHHSKLPRQNQQPRIVPFLSPETDADGRIKGRTDETSGQQISHRTPKIDCLARMEPQITSSRGRLPPNSSVSILTGAIFFPLTEIAARSGSLGPHRLRLTALSIAPAAGGKADCAPRHLGDARRVRTKPPRRSAPEVVRTIDGGPWTLPPSVSPVTGRGSPRTAPRCLVPVVREYGEDG